MTFGCVDDDGADGVLRAIKYRLALELFRKIVIRIAVIDARRRVFDRRLEIVESSRWPRLPQRSVPAWNEC